MWNPKIIWKNGSFRNRENLQYKKTAVSRLSFIESVHENKWKVQQFSCHLAPAKVVFCFPSEPNILELPEYEKISTLYLCTGRSFTNSKWHNYSWFSHVTAHMLSCATSKVVRTSDSLNEGLPIKMTREKFQRKWYFFYEKDSRFTPRLIHKSRFLIGQVPIEKYGLKFQFLLFNI